MDLSDVLDMGTLLYLEFVGWWAIATVIVTVVCEFLPTVVATVACDVSGRRMGRMGARDEPDRRSRCA